VGLHQIIQGQKAEREVLGGGKNTTGERGESAGKIMASAAEQPAG
jgi:hypothetical protein